MIPMNLFSFPAPDCFGTIDIEWEMGGEGTEDLSPEEIERNRERNYHASVPNLHQNRLSINGNFMLVYFICEGIKTVECQAILRVAWLLCYLPAWWSYSPMYRFVKNLTVSAVCKGNVLTSEMFPSGYAVFSRSLKSKGLANVHQQPQRSKALQIAVAPLEKLLKVQRSIAQHFAIFRRFKELSKRKP